MFTFLRKIKIFIMLENLICHLCKQNLKFCFLGKIYAVRCDKFKEVLKLSACGLSDRVNFLHKLLQKSPDKSFQKGWVIIDGKRLPGILMVFKFNWVKDQCYELS